MNTVETRPLVPLRDVVLFPHMVLPLFVGRARSIAAVDAAMASDKMILLATQRSPDSTAPEQDDIYEYGTLARVVQMLRVADGTVKLLVEGKSRVRIRKFLDNKAYFVVEAELLPDVVEEATEETMPLMRAVQSALESLAKLTKKIPAEVVSSLTAITDPGRLSDTIVPHLNLKVAERQALLELASPTKRLERLAELLHSEMEILGVEKKIKTRVRKQMEKSQRDYYLNEQMQAIQRELGTKDDSGSELNELENLAAKKKFPKEAKERFERELKKLRMMAPMSPESTVIRNYLDWMLALPWLEYTSERLDIEEARRILDEDHYGLDRAKERILEYLAVQALTGHLKGPILCFVGPPGVGKTSLARSIARSTGREYIRISLGGVKDEAEIRGHRRTYIGALPGRVIQSLRRVSSSNPVFLLDEVDKLSSDWRGDPSSALLEVLDPEQNNTFVDHYLDLDYDLSKVMFIATANYRDGIPVPLQDRMEIIELAGYTEQEKVQIARNFLVRKEKEANGLQDVSLDFTVDSLETLVRHYTRESGVRNLEREIAAICRKLAKEFVRRGRPDTAHYKVTGKTVPKYIGPHRFSFGKTDLEDQVGAVNGLAVTAAGGDLLTVEATVVPAADQSSGKVIITGSIKKVMEESGYAALTYVRSRAASLGLDPDLFSKVDLHVHIPEGAIPKDGPSAGITMASAIASAVTRIPAQAHVAMTGEITLRGRVLPIGGVKEKLMAAHRGGIKKVLLPKANEKDLRDVPQTVLKALDVVLVEHMDDVLRNVLRALPGQWSESSH